MNGPDRHHGIAVPDGEVLFYSIFGQTAVGVAVGSLEGKFLRANDALCRLLGYDEQELLEKSFQEVTHPDDRQASEEFQRELPPVGTRVLTAKGQGRVLAQEVLARKVLVEFEDGRRIPVGAAEILTRLGGR